MVNILQIPLHYANTTASVAITSALLLVVLYLINLNRLMTKVPQEIARLIPKRWTRQQIKDTYKGLCRNPISTASYTTQLPPKLNRRYIVTGGSGLVGGHIVLQLLERGQPPESIRIVDFQAPHRSDMLHGPAAKVDFRKTDIASVDSTEAAFMAPWGDAANNNDTSSSSSSSLAHLPLTVFHTAAVIIPSARSELVNGFCESVNVQGTRNVLAAAARAGADVFVSTSSASIAIRPVRFWDHWPWTPGLGWWRWLTTFPTNYWQVLDEGDFFRPLQSHEAFFGNYPASKAKAERIVCAANRKEFRTGCIRPGNGVYGHPTDNLLGTPLSLKVCPTYVSLSVVLSLSLYLCVHVFVYLCVYSQEVCFYFY